MERAGQDSALRAGKWRSRTILPEAASEVKDDGRIIVQRRLLADSARLYGRLTQCDLRSNGVNRLSEC